VIGDTKDVLRRRERRATVFGDDGSGCHLRMMA
jgi:hypothetical protein